MVIESDHLIDDYETGSK